VLIFLSNKKEADEIEEYFNEYVNESTPAGIHKQINNLKIRLLSSK
jgi:hypothetical protein